MHSIITDRPSTSIPIHPLTSLEFSEWSARQDAFTRRFLEATAYEPKAGRHLIVPAVDGSLQCVLTGIDETASPYVLSHLPAALPKGSYHLVANWKVETLERAALGWALASYRFDRYKQQERPGALLALPEGVDERRLRDLVSAVTLVRDLITTPAEDLGPAELSAAARSLAAESSASFEEIVGEELLERNYPAIHAVGRASVNAPRLIDLRWGSEGAPRLTLVGKGVCFDSGGLDLKTADGMRLMRKDMGGAAHVLGLASLVMKAGLPVRLRMLIAAVENSVSANSYRPGDVFRTRSGKTIEIGNTDAEGRVILSDALFEAASESPDLIVDFATLTGAARVALGPDLPALYCNRGDVAEGLLRAASREGDPLWRMPLHAPYRELIQSPYADLANMANTGLAGSITAALFLQDFVGAETPWVHYDVMAWNTRSRPGRPEGGEAMGLRATFAYLEERYGDASAGGRST